MPLPSTPFQTHLNIVFENGMGELTKKMTRSETGGTSQEIDANTSVENLKVVNQIYLITQIQTNFKCLMA